MTNNHSEEKWLLLYAKAKQELGRSHWGIHTHAVTESAARGASCNKHAPARSHVSHLWENQLPRTWWAPYMRSHFKILQSWIQKQLAEEIHLTHPYPGQAGAKYLHVFPLWYPKLSWRQNEARSASFRLSWGWMLCDEAKSSLLAKNIDQLSYLHDYTTYLTSPQNYLVLLVLGFGDHWGLSSRWRIKLLPAGGKIIAGAGAGDFKGQGNLRAWGALSIWEPLGSVKTLCNRLLFTGFNEHWLHWGSDFLMMFHASQQHHSPQASANNSKQQI